ncbi:MAG TPA: AraC family transcriptional regulator [Planctomycetota bacterium]|jgi:AraC-like DNA-binding protein|nr:AraC family transcriptional regulator [Planctomycetota bacterium]
MNRVSTPAAEPRSFTAAMQALAALTPHVRIAREEHRPPWHIPDRRLFDYLVVYIVAGAGRFTVGAETFPVDAGDFVWIPPDTFHAMESRADPQHLLYAHFDLVYDSHRSPRVAPPPAYFQDLRAQPELIHPPVRLLGIDRWCGRLPLMNLAIIHQTLKRMVYEHMTARNPLVQAGLVYEMLGAILNGLHPGSAPNASHQQALQRAADRILAAATDPLDIAGLAQEARLSVPHFRKLFRAMHGQSPRALHQVVKMQKACEWIDYSNWNLSEIAAKLGFSNVHNFSRAFKEVIGHAPSDYRHRRM